MTSIKEWSLTQRAVVEDNYTILAQGDIGADVFGVDAGKALTGFTCTANFIRADGVTVQLQGGISGRTASVALTEECLYYDGAFTLALFLADSAHRYTARVISGRVVRTISDRILDKGAVYDISAMRAEINKKVDKPSGTGNTGNVLVADGQGGTAWGDPDTATSAGQLRINGVDYLMRTGTSGAAGYVTFVPEA